MSTASLADQADQIREEIKCWETSHREPDGLIRDPEAIAAMEKLAAAEATIRRIAEHERFIGLIHKSNMRAIKRWQDAHPGNDDTWPDRTDMVAWLMEQLTAVKASRDHLNQLINNSVAEIAAERHRQITDEGWTPEHDDQHSGAELLKAATCYAYCVAELGGLPDESFAQITPPPSWPWSDDWWKPKTPRSALIRAAALIAAEIDRRDRNEATS